MGVSAEGCAVPELFLASEVATEELGGALAVRTPPGGAWLLKGELGAGKTTWARGFVAGLGGRPEQVSSPTYAILHRYDTPSGRVFHLDIYRLGPSGAWSIGLEDSLTPADRLVVEWAEHKEGLGPWSSEWVSFLDLSYAPGGRLAAWGGSIGAAGYG
jgi:tRNA threonylcarbamoyladenosine biosynthesis protein TsaE